MTVKQLKEQLIGIPDDTPILLHDSIQGIVPASFDLTDVVKYPRHDGTADYFWNKIEGTNLPPCEKIKALVVV